MAKVATAGQQARAKLRELRTAQAAARAEEERQRKAAEAEQDARIEAAVARLVASTGALAAAAKAMTEAQQQHATAVEVAAAELRVVVHALRSEGLSPADIVALTGLPMLEVRRASKAKPDSQRAAGEDGSAASEAAGL